MHRLTVVIGEIFDMIGEDHKIKNHLRLLLARVEPKSALHFTSAEASADA